MRRPGANTISVARRVLTTVVSHCLSCQPGSKPSSRHRLKTREPSICGGSPQTLSSVPFDDHLRLFPLLFVSIPTQTSLKCVGDNLMPYQTEATAGKSPNLILSPGLRKRLDSSNSCCEVAASETWLSTCNNLKSSLRTRRRTCKQCSSLCHVCFQLRNSYKGCTDVP
jgi:hypothetical protein